MDKALNAWFEKLKNAAVPALPQNLASLASLAADDNVAMGRLIGVIEQDPGLTIALLRTINAVKHKHLRTEVTTVEHGLMMLGLTKLRTIPAQAPSMAKLGDATVRSALQRVYSRSYHAACQAREWARLRKDLEPGEIYCATQLHGIAEILLWAQAPKEMARVDELTHQDRMEPEEAQYVSLGFGLDQLTVALGQEWGLPSLLCDSLQPENAQNQRVLGIMLAIQLARAMQFGWYTHQVTSVLEQIAEYLHYDYDSTVAHVHETAARASRLIHDPQLLPPALGLLFPSQPEAELGWEPPEQEADSPSPQQGEKAPNEHEPPADFCLAPQRQVLRRSMVELNRHMDGTLSLSQALHLSLEGMHDGLGLNRVVFAMLTQEKRHLKARGIRGSDNDPTFNRFAVELDGWNLFSRVMEKPQALWLNDKNRSKFWPLVPEGLYQITRSNAFFVMSVFVKGKPVGLFYADRHTGSCRLDPRAYHYFKQLVQQTAKTLEHLSSR